MKGSLYYCMVASKDVKNDYEHVIYITNYFVPKDIRILECNLHLIWTTIVFTFFYHKFKCAKLGLLLNILQISYYRWSCIIKPKSKLLVIVKCFCICFQTFTLCIFQSNLK